MRIKIRTPGQAAAFLIFFTLYVPFDAYRRDPDRIGPRIEKALGFDPREVDFQSLDLGSGFTFLVLIGVCGLAFAVWVFRQVRQVQQGELGGEESTGDTLVVEAGPADASEEELSFLERYPVFLWIGAGLLVMLLWDAIGGKAAPVPPAPTRAPVVSRPLPSIPAPPTPTPTPEPVTPAVPAGPKPLDPGDRTAVVAALVGDDRERALEAVALEEQGALRLPGEKLAEVLGKTEDPELARRVLERLLTRKGAAVNRVLRYQVRVRGPVAEQADAALEARGIRLRPATPEDSRVLQVAASAEGRREYELEAVKKLGMMQGEAATNLLRRLKGDRNPKLQEAAAAAWAVREKEGFLGW